MEFKSRTQIVGVLAIVLGSPLVSPTCGTMPDTDKSSKNLASTLSMDIMRSFAILSMLKMDIDIVRISPQQQHLDEIIGAFDAARHGAAVQPDTTGWSTCGLVDGYWFGEAGIVQHQAPALTQSGARA